LKQDKVQQVAMEGRVRRCTRFVLCVVCVGVLALTMTMIPVNAYADSEEGYSGDLGPPNPFGPYLLRISDINGTIIIDSNGNGTGVVDIEILRQGMVLEIFNHPKCDSEIGLYPILDDGTLGHYLMHDTTRYSFEYEYRTDEYGVHWMVYTKSVFYWQDLEPMQPYVFLYVYTRGTPGLNHEYVSRSSYYFSTAGDGTGTGDEGEGSGDGEAGSDGTNTSDGDQNNNNDSETQNPPDQNSDQSDTSNNHEYASSPGDVQNSQTGITISEAITVQSRIPARSQSLNGAASEDQNRASESKNSQEGGARGELLTAAVANGGKLYTVQGGLLQSVIPQPQEQVTTMINAEVIGIGIEGYLLVALGFCLPLGLITRMSRFRLGIRKRVLAYGFQIHYHASVFVSLHRSCLRHHLWRACYGLCR